MIEGRRTSSTKLSSNLQCMCWAGGGGVCGKEPLSAVNTVTFEIPWKLCGPYRHPHSPSVHVGPTISQSQGQELGC